MDAAKKREGKVRVSVWIDPEAFLAFQLLATPEIGTAALMEDWLNITALMTEALTAHAEWARTRLGGAGTGGAAVGDRRP